MAINRVGIIGGKRTPFMKSFGSYANLTLHDLLKPCFESLVKEYGLEGEELGDVSIGAVIKSTADFSLAREAVLNSKLSPLTPGFDIQRACGTSLEAAIAIGNKIALGQIESGIAGGADTNSDAPLGFSRKAAHKFMKLSQAQSLADKVLAATSFRPTDFLPKIPSVTEPRTGMSMGQHCELMAKEWQIPREDQDQLAYESHQKAESGYRTGFYKTTLADVAGYVKDGLVRGDTTVEKLSKLRPAFDKTGSGTLTAGNSTPLTDGAAITFLCSEDYAKRKNLEIAAFLVDAEVAAVDFVKGEGLLMAPTVAVKRLLARNKLTFSDFDFFEIHEAFAAQALCTLRAWESKKYCVNRLGLPGPLGSIDRDKMNIKGGSLALGHPFAATGSRILNGLAEILKSAKKGRGLISICTAGGMGVTAIVER
jgi:acetyl-CoA C-acetyltransferase